MESIEECIKNKNYGTPTSMYPTFILGSSSRKSKAGILRENFKDIMITNYEVVKINDSAAAVTMITVKIAYEYKGMLKEKNVDFRVIYEVNGEVNNRLKLNGSWKITNIEGISYMMIE